MYGVQYPYMKKTITSEDKAKAALEALTETDTLARIASKYGAHPIQGKRGAVPFITHICVIIKPPSSDAPVHGL